MIKKITIIEYINTGHQFWRGQGFFYAHDYDDILNFSFKLLNMFCSTKSDKFFKQEKSNNRGMGTLMEALLGFPIYCKVKSYLRKAFSETLIDNSVCYGIIKEK